MADFVEVHVTTDSREEADAICQAVVESRVAACAQVTGPITSRYWWEGKLETSEEWLLLMKTRADRYGDLQRVVQARHSYDTPEIIAVPVVAGNDSYLEWIDSETRAESPARS